MAKLQWRDSDEIYKPINYSLSSFLQDRKDLIDQSKRSSICCQVDTIDEMAIFVFHEAEDQLKDHLQIDPNNESGGVLVGQAYQCTETN